MSRYEEAVALFVGPRRLCRLKTSSLLLHLLIRNPVPAIAFPQACFPPASPPPRRPAHVIILRRPTDHQTPKAPTFPKSYSRLTQGARLVLQPRCADDPRRPSSRWRRCCTRRHELRRPRQRRPRSRAFAFPTARRRGPQPITPTAQDRFLTPPLARPNSARPDDRAPTRTPNDRYDGARRHRAPATPLAFRPPECNDFLTNAKAQPPAGATSAPRPTAAQSFVAQAHPEPAPTPHPCPPQPAPATL